MTPKDIELSIWLAEEFAKFLKKQMEDIYTINREMS